MVVEESIRGTLSQGSLTLTATFSTLLRPVPLAQGSRDSLVGFGANEL